MYRFFRFLFTWVLVGLAFSAFSQITSNAEFSEATTFDENIKIFVFCTDLTNAGELIANDSTSTGGFDFTWFKFDENSLDFTIALTEYTINNDSSSSGISDLEDGGYKVVLTKGAEEQKYIAWVYNNNDRSVQLNLEPDSDCDYLALSTDPYYHTNQFFETPFRYYHVDSAEWYTLNNQVEQYTWTASPELESLRNYNGPFTSMADDNNANLPTENTVFSVLTIDRFGCEADDDLDYTAIATEAKFKIMAIDDDGLVMETSEESVSGAAPLKVRFENLSENGYQYTYFFGDTLIDNDEDVIVTTDLSLQPEHTYYYTAPDSGKTYTAWLKSESSYGCRDSMFVGIFVEPTSIEFPNVFTPNNDNINDVYQLTDFKSIRDFKITIFNRVGQVVHQFEGDARDWEGWDGTVKNSNREAPDGNYFFVVEVIGWDRKSYNNKNLNYTGVNDASEDGESAGGNFFGIIRLFR
ncbi:MAG: gliding motility-associated C-terminal domain-containing protein [Bacteroidales bacterium]